MINLLPAKKILVNAMALVVRPSVQVVAVIISLSCIAGLAYYPFILFRPLEKKSQLYSIAPQFFESSRANPAVVSVGLYIDNFSEFDIIKNKFSFAGVIWFEFDPALASLDIIDGFSFEQGKIIEKSAPSVHLIEDRLFVRYIIRVEFKTDLDYRLFPLDDHRVNIALINRVISPNEMVFNSGAQNFSISPAAHLGGWFAADTNVRAGYSTALLQSDDMKTYLDYPKVVFAISAQRNGLQGILLIFLPLFLISFITLFTLSFDPETDSRSMLSLATSGLASLIGYRFIIQGISPDVGYFMLSDQIFILFLTFVFAIFPFTLLLSRRGKLTDNIIILRGFVFILFHLTVLAWWYYLLYWWI